MSDLRNRMIQDMKLAGLVDGTRREYLRAVRQLTAHYKISPDRLTEWHQAEHVRNRKTPRSSASESRKRKRTPKRAPAERYSTRAYDHAISRACKRAEVPG